MMNSTSRVYVWTWLPGRVEPVPSGVLVPGSAGLSFTYGRRYLERSDAISLSPTLPLRAEAFPPTEDQRAPGAIRDASPDAWGRRVVLNALTGERGSDVDIDRLDERTYMLRSGTNRLGAIDFQESPAEYRPREDTSALDTLHEAAALVERGADLPPELRPALLSGTAMGGARPKAMVTDSGRDYLAKFSVSTDSFPVVGAEAASVYLARLVGIDVPEAQVIRSLGRSVLLMKRFDRSRGGFRHHVVSALTLLGLGEMTSRYGTYIDILDSLQEHGAPGGTATELFRRVAFNLAISNTDDHLRNHAAFWDGRSLALTPAYDLAPGPRSGETASLTTAYSRSVARSAELARLVKAASEFGLSRSAGRGIVLDIISMIEGRWNDAAEFAMLSYADKDLLWRRQFLNPGSLYGL